MSGVIGSKICLDNPSEVTNRISQVYSDRFDSVERNPRNVPSELLMQLTEVIRGLLPRKPGKLIDECRLRKVHQLKAEGLSQKQTTEKFGFSKQAAHDLWHRKLDVWDSSPPVEQGVSAW